MKNVLKQGIKSGFTIVEVLIVLGVSAAILLAAILLVGGRQNQEEFTQSINDIQNQIQATINDINNGYYPYSNQFKCASGSTNNGQGTNGGCTFVGKAIQFGVLNTNPEQYWTYTIAGQQTGINSPTSYKDAKIDIPTTSSGTLLMATDGILENGLTAQSMYYCQSACSVSSSHSVGAVAFLSKLSPSTSGCSTTCVGGQQLYLVPVSIAALQLHTSVAQAVADMNNVIGSSTALAATADNFVPNNLPQSVNICFASGTTNDSGLITITNGEGQLVVNLKIYSGSTICS